jgi:hypothetical protein
VWDSNWAESFQPVDIVEAESAQAIRKVLAGVDQHIRANLFLTAVVEYPEDWGRG